MEKLQVTLNNRDWDRLLQEIDNERVVLVIGDQLSMLNIDGKQTLLRDYIFDKMAASLGMAPQDVKDFSMLSKEYKLAEWQRLSSEPYTETYYILKDIPREAYVTDHLKRLLSIDKFKTVLTTSFDNIAYSVMREIHGNTHVKAYSYSKNSAGDDIPLTSPDYNLYHLFGKASPTQHGFVLTEDDLLEFIHSWMDQSFRPENLDNILQNRYLLVIGCDYPNWLFRFFFHSLRFSPTNNYGRQEKSYSGLLADNNLDHELIRFLQRMETKVHNDALNFIEELVNRWQAYTAEKESADNIMIAGQKKSDLLSDKKEVFISYASEDYEAAREIADIFREMGLDPWFDKYDLKTGDEYENIIKYRIENSRVFIPLLSANTEKNDEARFFRKEWKWASIANDSHFGLYDNFIQPLIIDDFVPGPRHPFIGFHTTNISDKSRRREIIRHIIRNIRLK